MADHIIMRAFDEAFHASGMAVLEIPPGVGKTYTLVRLAVEEASRRRTIIFALPNHQALQAAFSYALVHYRSLERLVPDRRLPYIVYYAGTNRYCPFSSAPDQEDMFARAVDQALGEGAIGEDEARLMQSLGLRGTDRILGRSTVCRKVCPVYREPLGLGKRARILVVPEAVRAVENPAPFEPGAPPPQNVKEAYEYFVRRGMIEVFYPGIDPLTLRPSGRCIRQALYKPVTGRAQIYMRGALILAPMQSLDYLARLVSSRVEALRRSGMIIPRPGIIVDEYDSYVYRPRPMRLVTLEGPKGRGRARQANLPRARREDGRRRRAGH